MTMEVFQAGRAAVTQLLNTAAGWKRSTIRYKPLIWSSVQSLPVAGLDVLAAQTVLYALRTSTPADQGNTVAETWLQTLLLAQVASDRLLQSLVVTHHQLTFWRARLAAGDHGTFMLLSQGPVGFVHELVNMLQHVNTAWRNRQQQQQQNQHYKDQQQQSSSSSTAAAASSSGSHHPGSSASSDRIQERVAVLQLLFTQLCEALAAVHSAAAKLKVVEAAAAAAAAAGPTTGPTDLHEAAVAAVADCVSEVTQAVRHLQHQVDHIQQYEAAVSQVRSRVAGSVPHQDNTQQQQQQQQSAGTFKAAAAAAAAVKSRSMSQLDDDLHELRELLGIHDSVVTQGRRRSDTGAVLSSAAAAAAHLGPLAAVPAWATMPSALQRHWIKYSIAAAAGVSAAAFLHRHSRLAGSRDLDDWLAAAAAAVKGAWSEHVVSPLVVVRDELFSTFRDRPSMVSSAEFEADKQSLLRMLTDFQQDHPAAVAAAAAAVANAPAAAAAANPTTVPTPTTSSSSSIDSLPDSAAVNQGMQVVMRCYERDLKSPIRNLVTGELARTLLIQVQRLKLDTEAAMLELDQILRANELSISLVAAVPALLLSWTLLRGVWLLLLTPAPPDPKRQAMPCRLAMARLERALSALQSAEDAANRSSRSGASTAAKQQQQDSYQQQQQHEDEVVSSAEGAVLFRLHEVFVEAQMLYRLKDRSSKYSEWPQLKADLLELVQPGMSAAAKLDLHSRMTRTFTVLRP